MKRTLAVIAFAVCCVIVPVNGQTPSKDPSSNRQQGANAQAPKRKDSAPSTVNIETVNVNKLNVPQQPDTAGKGDKDSQQPPSYFSRLVAPETLPNTILCLIGFGGILAAFYTLQEMRGQRGQMEKQTAELQSAQETALINARAAVISAKAAKASADVAVAVSIPTLKIERFVTGNTGAANIRAILQFPKVSITIKNYGQTPAFLQWWSIMFTCDGLPDIPVYGGNSYGMPLDKEVVQPNDPYILPDLKFFQRPQISLKDVEAIIRREKVLSVYGYVAYGDLFDNPLRRLKFCEFAIDVLDNAEGGAIEWCQETHPDYSGTDLLPVSKSSSSQGIESLRVHAGADTNDHPEKAN